MLGWVVCIGCIPGSQGLAGCWGAGSRRCSGAAGSPDPQAAAGLGAGGGAPGLGLLCPGEPGGRLGHHHPGTGRAAGRGGQVSWAPS